MDDFYAARSRIIPPLPWPIFAPPFSHMRAEALRGRREAFYSFGGGLAVYGGMIALGAVLGIVLLLLIQGRGDAHSFGRNPGLFCTTAGGERGTTSSSGEGYCVFWTDR